MTTGSTRVRSSARKRQHFQALILGKLRVEQDDGRHERFPRPPPLPSRMSMASAPIVRHDDVVQNIVLLKGAAGQQFIVCVIFDQENDFIGHGDAPR